MRHLLPTIVVVLCTASVAAADSVPTRARALAERGRAAHDQRDYAGAIAAFTEAYAIAPAPALLFNLAQAYRLAGRCDDAALMYRRFLASNPPDDARGLAEQHLSSVERCGQTQSPKISLAVTTMPLPHLAERSPVTEGQPDHDSSLRIAGLGLTVTGGLALVAGGYYAYEAHAASSEVERRYGMGEKYKQLASLDAEGHHDAKVATIAIAGGLVAAAVGTTVLLVDRHQRHASKHRIELTPAKRGAKVSMTWRF